MPQPAEQAGQDVQAMPCKLQHAHVIVRPHRGNCSRKWETAASTQEGDQVSWLHCRTNYALIIVAALGVALLRNPGALVACGVCLSAALCLNDTFATTLR